MRLHVKKTDRLQGEIVVPASKSHTIRAVILAALADGKSVLHNPLFSEDTKAAIGACTALGADIEQKGSTLVVRGFGPHPRQPAGVLDMLNSGTSTNLLLGTVAALGIEAEISGDSSLCSRPVTALADALTALGCTVDFRDKQGYPPVKISGKLKGGSVAIDASKSSQYISSLLLACPLLDTDTSITVSNPSELPYIEMTLSWLDQQGIAYERDGYSRFTVFGGQTYRPFEKSIPGDWSSATFPICAAAVTSSDVVLKGIDVNDVQGDKAVIEYLGDMGAEIEIRDDGIRIIGKGLVGKELDINATPDALPALAVVGCCARGTTKLYNVAQARVKETDRITVMARELKKMHARVQELPDGLLIEGGPLTGANVHGHSDHRVVMALSIAAMTARGQTTIDTAEAVSVTYPHFIETMNTVGASIKFTQEVQ